jgi:hypothetical protein
MQSGDKAVPTLSRNRPVAHLLTAHLPAAAELLLQPCDLVP